MAHRVQSPWLAQPRREPARRNPYKYLIFQANKLRDARGRKVTPRIPLLLTRGRVQQLVKPRDGSGAGFDTEFLENTGDMAMNGAKTEAQDERDLTVALALANPPKDFAFPLTEAEAAELQPRRRGFMRDGRGARDGRAIGRRTG